MNLSFLRSRQARKITNWKLGTCQNLMPSHPLEAMKMEQATCPCIKQEICNGVYWVTNDCANGVKEGFRPRVAFTHTCEHCSKQARTNSQA